MEGMGTKLVSGVHESSEAVADPSKESGSGEVGALAEHISKSMLLSVVISKFQSSENNVSMSRRRRERVCSGEVHSKSAM